MGTSMRMTSIEIDFTMDGEYRDGDAHMEDYIQAHQDLFDEIKERIAMIVKETRYKEIHAEVNFVWERIRI